MADFEARILYAGSREKRRLGEGEVRKVELGMRNVEGGLKRGGEVRKVELGMRKVE
jgi:hypothetical protein